VVVDVGAQHRRNLYQSRNCLVAKIPIKATIPNLTSAALQNRNFRNGCKAHSGVCDRMHFSIIWSLMPNALWPTWVSTGH